MAKKYTTTTKKTVETLRHADSKRTNIPTAEQQSVMETEEKYSIRVAYERRNRDLDPQLVWRGKDEQDAQPLVANAPPLYIQEKAHPKVLIDDLMRRTDDLKDKGKATQLDLFGDFNGLPEEARSAEFYQHESNWTNRMILGDSLQVMASLAEREGLRGKVQCIYFDPPYGIKFNSNFQWSTNDKSTKEDKVDFITREPEQVKAFRDTWSDGIHSYLTYLRERLIACFDLLADTGTVFVQIGTENVHRVRAVLDEVFTPSNCIAEILVKKKGSQKGGTLKPVNDYVLWYGKQPQSSGAVKTRSIFEIRDDTELFSDFPFAELADGLRISVSELEQRDDEIYKGDLRKLTRRYPGIRLFAANPLKSGGHRRQQSHNFFHEGRKFPIKPGQCWKHTVVQDDGTTPGMTRHSLANQLFPQKTDVRFIKYAPSPPIREISNWWDGFGGASDQVYVVQTNERLLSRCILMATDPGDLVLDPTCGSGTTALTSEYWGRRWITIDTSRVALALARCRIMGNQFPYFLLSDSDEGREKLSELDRVRMAPESVSNNITFGFVYKRATNITSSVIANNAEIEVVHAQFQTKLEPLRKQLNAALNQSWEEWEIPREAGERWDADATAAHAEVMALRRECAATMEILVSLDLESQEDRLHEMIRRRAKKFLAVINQSTGGKFDFDSLPDEPRDPWPDEAKKLHAKWWKLRIERQKEIDASIAAKADFEYLYDKPYEDKTKVRVAGPFTVESLSPHRTLSVGADDELIDPLDQNPTRQRVTDTSDREIADFATMVLDNLKKSGVQQAHKEDKIDFTSLVPWPGEYIAAEGRFSDVDGKEQRAGIFIGPEFGTISQPDLKAAARECGDAGFDVLCLATIGSPGGRQLEFLAGWR